jgi:hypothetical protein
LTQKFVYAANKLNENKIKIADKALNKLSTVLYNILECIYLGVLRVINLSRLTSAFIMFVLQYCNSGRGEMFSLARYTHYPAVLAWKPPYLMAPCNDVE